jgi:hypothetical protein
VVHGVDAMHEKPGLMVISHQAALHIVKTAPMQHSVLHVLEKCTGNVQAECLCRDNARDLKKNCKVIVFLL